MKKILIIGFGLIGRERFIAANQLNSNSLSISIDVFDPYISHEAVEFINTNNSVVIKSINPNVIKNYNLVIISTPHDVAEEYLKLIFLSNIDVLIEKPLGRNYIQTLNLIQSKGVGKLHVGFNYPYFDSVANLLKDVKSNIFGEIISISMEMGHGNHPGAENSWKLDPIRSGGGCLLDPGIHLLDLCLLLTNGNLKLNYANSWEGFWNKGYEEEIQISLVSGKILLSITISMVKWKSEFKIQVNGTNGYGNIIGRGRSYGEQIYKIGERWSWKNGKSQSENEQIRSQSDCSESFTNELLEILSGRADNYQRALDGMKLYDEIQNFIIQNKKGLI